MQGFGVIRGKGGGFSCIFKKRKRGYPDGVLSLPLSHQTEAFLNVTQHLFPHTTGSSIDPILNAFQLSKFVLKAQSSCRSSPSGRKKVGSLEDGMSAAAAAAVCACVCVWVGGCS